MRAGVCPNCGVMLDFIFGDPEVEVAFKRAGWLRFVGIEKYIEDHEGAASIDGGVFSRESLKQDAEECPSCGGLIAPVTTGITPADILNREIVPDDLSLQVAT